MMTATQGSLLFPGLFLRSLANVFQWIPLLFRLPFKRHVESILALHFTAEGLRLALILPTLSGRREVAYLASLKVQDIAEKEFQNKFQTILSQLRLQNPVLVGIVPAEWTVTRNIEIPSRNPDEIRQIIGLQAGRHTPYSRNEIVVDYLDLGVVKNVYTKILLLIVPNASVKRYYDLAERAKLKLDRICFAPESAAQCLASYGGALPQPSKPSCILNVDRGGAEFLVAQEGKVVFVRNIPIGTQLLVSEKDTYAPRLLEELKKSLEAYQTENIGENPVQMYVTGGSGGLENVEAYLEPQLGFPVKRWRLAESLPIRMSMREACSSHALSFLNVMAPALVYERLTVDLVPEERKLKKAIEERSREILMIGVLTVLLIGLVCISFFSHLYFKHAQLDQMKRRFEPIRREAEQLQVVHGRLQMIKDQMKNQGKSLKTLVELYKLIPDDAYLTEVRYETTGSFSLKGTGRKRSSVFSFVDKMEQSAFFKNVQTRYVSGRTEEGMELADFQIAALLE